MGLKPRPNMVIERCAPRPPPMSLRQAKDKGIRKLRLPHWALPTDHIEINVHDGLFGPWVKLWSDGNIVAGNKNPHPLLINEFDLDAREWLPYRPPANGVHRAK